MFFGLCRKSWKIFHSPCPVVLPNAAGCRSDMSNRNSWARASAIAVARWIGSLYALGFTFLFGDENPPRAAQIDAACGVARYLISASDAGVSLNMTTMSPPPITAGLDPLIDGNANWLKPVI